MSTISACMIVRDEEKVLARCLDSIKDWVDEIIVVDTGSNDKTIEIAKSYGAKVYEQEWTDDFSFHRNYSMKQATGDWIFIIDADEQVLKEDGETIRKMMDDGIEQSIIAVDCLNLYGEDKIARSRLPQLRFFKREYNPEYNRFVHNRPLIRPGTQIYRLPFRILHDGYDSDPETMAKKDARRLRMCRKYMDEEPDNYEAYLHYARAIITNGSKFNNDVAGEALQVIDKGIELCGGENDPQNIYLQLLELASLVAYNINETQRAADYAEEALRHKPDFLDALFLAGLSYTYGIDFNKGADYLKRYLVEQEIYEFSDKMDSLVLEFANSREQAYLALADIEAVKAKNALALAS